MNDHGPASSHLGRALSSPDPEERRRAVSQLGSVPLPRAVPLVLAALGDDDWRVRKEATFVAREFLPAEGMITALVGVLDTRDVGLCNAAVDVLGAAGAAATPHLDAALRGLGPDGRKLAVEALGRTRDREALAPLRRSLEEADPNIRQTAAESVAALAAVAPDVVEGLLLSVLDDADPIVRLSALSGLDALGAIIPWERLAPLLDDATLRPLALAAVARAGHAGAPAVLARALGASWGRTFDAALAAFARVPLDPMPEAALAALRAYEPAISDRLVAAARTGAGDEAFERRRTALLVGAALGDPRIIGVAVEALGEPGLGGAAQAALEMLGAPAVQALVTRLEGDADDEAEDDARTLCVEALAHIAQNNAASLAPQRAPSTCSARSAKPKTSLSPRPSRSAPRGRSRTRPRRRSRRWLPGTPRRRGPSGPRAKGRPRAPAPPPSPSARSPRRASSVTPSPGRSASCRRRRPRRTRPPAGPRRRRSHAWAVRPPSRPSCTLSRTRSRRCAARPPAASAGSPRRGTTPGCSAWCAPPGIRSSSRRPCARRASSFPRATQRRSPGTTRGRRRPRGGSARPPRPARPTPRRRGRR